MENTDLSITLDSFAKIVIEKWKLKIAALNIGRTDDLLRSFDYTVHNEANGDLRAIIFVFNYYGKFVDMGVGGNVSLSSTERGFRKPKQWYSKVFYAQVERLKEIMIKKYEAQAVDMLVNENWTGKTSSGGSTSKRQPADKGRGYTSAQYDRLHGN